jgi:putative membrane protein
MELANNLQGLANFSIYFVVSLLLLTSFVVIYAQVTPYRELALIADGNEAAAYSLGGALIGFALPLSSAISHSVGLADMAIWGLVALLVQVLTFLVVRMLLPKIVSDIPANKASKGILLGVVSVVVGMLNAACMTY